MIALLFFILLIPGGLLYSQTDSLYQKGILSLADNNIELAEELFEEAAEKNNDARAYFELAKILVSQGSIKALAMAKEAVKLDSLNSDYIFFLGSVYEQVSKYSASKRMLMMELNPIGNAIKTYEQLIKINPDYPITYQRLSKLYREEYYKIRHTVSYTQPDYQFETLTNPQSAAGKIYNEFLNENLINGGEAVLNYSQMSVSYLSKATYYSRRLLKYPLKTNDDYFETALLYVQANLPDSGIIIAKEGLSFFPDDENLFLVMGYLNYKSGNLSESAKNFNSAFELMSDKDVKDYKVHTVFCLLTPEVKEDVEDMTENEVETFIKNYWNQRDPFNITEFNERELEHYSRVFYANYFFGLPEKTKKGWSTDRGEILIRYGEPKKYMNIRRKLTDVSRRPIPETDVMVYNDKTFAFVDILDNDEFVYAQKYDGPSSFLADSKYLSESLKSSNPEEFFLKLKAPVLEIPNNLLQFRDSSGSYNNLYLSFALPIPFDPNGKVMQDSYTYNLLFMGNEFNSIFRKNGSVYSRYIPQLNYDSIKYNLAVTQLSALPSSGTMSFELLRHKDKAIYVNHGQYEIRNFSGTRLNLSDVILADDITEGYTRGKIQRGDLSILPNPTRSFSLDNLPYLYFEVYNLKHNEKSLTDFEQEIILERKEDTNFIEDAWNFIVGTKTENNIHLKSNYNTIEEYPRLFIQLDLANYDPGEYNVTIKIKDNISGEKAESKVAIIWQ